MTIESVNEPVAANTRVLHIYRRFHPDFTGDGIYYQALLPILAKLGSEHHILATETPRPTVSEPASRMDDSPEVFYLNAERRESNLISLYSWIFSNRNRYDIMHIHSHVDRYFISYLMARMAGWSVIFSCTLDDSPSHLLQSYKTLYRPLVRLLMRAVDKFVAISPFLRDGITAVLPEKKALLLPQGVKLQKQDVTEARRQFRAEQGIADSTTVLVYAGSICLRKNVGFLIQQMPDLLSKHKDLQLIVVGPTLEEDYASHVYNLVEQLGIEDKVKFAGYRQDMYKFYVIGDVFVFASDSEGFGNVLLEAMSFGLPVVSRLLDGVTDYFIQHGDNGFLFRTAEEYRSQVLELIAKPEKRQLFAQHALALVQSDFSLEAIARRYADLYTELRHAKGHSVQCGVSVRTTASGCSSMNAGPAAVGMRPIAQAVSMRPTLITVIDTESEFDWAAGVAADRGAVTSIASLDLAQEIFDQYGVKPCYVVDYPVASHPESAAKLRAMVARGAEIGAHLQPWTTPPMEEALNQWHSFPGNLDSDLLRRKLMILVETIRKNIGVTPLSYKAGRYGISHSTLKLLEEMGFEADLSVGSGFDYRLQGGPDFSRYATTPYAFGAKRRLLELPTTGGFTGTLRNHGPALWRLTDNPPARAIHLRGVLDRTGTASIVRLSPEGHDIGQLKALTRTLLAEGERVFTLSFHSSSLAPGFTPYVRNKDELKRLLATMQQYIDYFLNQIGGESLTPSEARQKLIG